MAHSGSEPKPNPRHRNPVAEWNEVVDLPYDGESPDLPPLPRRRKWHQSVVVWWEEIRRMPHCRLWMESDWRFAIETAQLKQQLWQELDECKLTINLAIEIRRREGEMGNTHEARRKLRIRYVPSQDLGHQAPTPADVAAAAAASVTDLNSRRKRLSA